MESRGGASGDGITRKVYPRVGFTNTRINPEPRVLARWIAEDCGRPEEVAAIEVELRCLPKQGLWLLHHVWLRSQVGTDELPEGFTLKALAGVQQAFPAEAGEETSVALA